MAPPSGYPNPLSLFTRGRPAPPRRNSDLVDEEEAFEDLEDDFDSNLHDITQGEYEGTPVDELDPEDEIDDTDDIDTDDLDSDELDARELLEGRLDDDDDEQMDDDEDEEMHDREPSPDPLPPDLRDLASLASWTVSTYKPDYGVEALRHPSPQKYWQSDGPQPHTLTLHFFKLVAIVRIRVYLDFSLDESYTPTKMEFLAGMGGNDLVEFATWEGEGPRGWVDIDLEGVGGRNGGWVRENLYLRDRKAKAKQRKSKSQKPDHEDAHSESDTEPLDGVDPVGDEMDPYCGNVLKAMVLQMRILENHQNGKDTHVRGFQVFSCDDTRRRVAAAPSASADGRDRQRRVSMRRSVRGSSHDPVFHARLASDDLDTSRLGVVSGLDEPDWMGEPVIR